MGMFLQGSEVSNDGDGFSLPVRQVWQLSSFQHYHVPQVLYDTKVRIWSSSRLVAQGSIGGFTDGIHAGEVAVKYDTQVMQFGRCGNLY